MPLPLKDIEYDCPIFSDKFEIRFTDSSYNFLSDKIINFSKDESFLEIGLSLDERNFKNILKKAVSRDFPFTEMMIVVYSSSRLQFSTIEFSAEFYDYKLSMDYNSDGLCIFSLIFKTNK